MTRVHRLVPLRRAFHLLAALAATASPAAAQLLAPPVQFWNEGSPGLVSSLQADVHFGYAMTAGDFDCNGFDDLAIGVPEDDDEGGAVPDTGYVMVLYGGEAGLGADGHQLWDQQSLVAAEEEADDHFGETLAAGDFDGDGCDDLAIGAPQEDIGTETDAGAVSIVYGSASGLTAVGNAFFRQGDGGITAAPEAFDNFGQALAAADFDGDGFDDLAIGVPNEDIEATPAGNAGALHILFGSASGLTGNGDLVLFRGNGLPGTPVVAEQLGAALATGDFNPLFPGDDLAIGAPGGTAGAVTRSGLVLLYSDIGGSGFVATYSQATAGVPGVEEQFDEFGAALAGGDFDGDGIAELAVGSPGEDLEPGPVNNVGAVTILDFDGDGHTSWIQDDLAPEHSEPIDEFGRVLAAGDFDGDGVDDLAIGVPLEDLGPVLTTGLVHVLYGEPGTGLTADRDQIWIEAVDPSEDGDRFGFALAAGHFSGHSGTDLAVGAPWEELSGLPAAGALNVFFSRDLFLDGFETGDTLRWSVTAP